MYSGGHPYMPEPGFESITIAESYSSYSGLQEAKPIDPNNTVHLMTVT